jgi:bifunctional non-homologous end joining protein LigD
LIRGTLNREEFVVVGWTDPEGRRPWLGALLLARGTTGLCRPRRHRHQHRRGESLWRRLQPLATGTMALDVPPRSSRFGSPLVLSRVHWVRRELVAEVKFLNWTDDNLLRQVIYEGLREDKPAVEVRHEVPHPKS